MKTVEASLSIEVNVECPHCEEYINLMEFGDLNEEGFISMQAVPSGDWSEPHDNFELDINCNGCGKEINIRRIAW